MSALGLARAECEPDSELSALLVRLQRELFVVGAELATAPDNRRKLTDGTTRVTAAMVEALEPIIDDITTRFDPPLEFVLPGENRVAAALDVARTTVRRAERACVDRDPRRLARAREPGRAVPQPARRLVLDSRPLAGRPLPRRSRRPLTRRSLEESCSISFTVASTAPARARADILAVPVTAGPTLGHGADAVEAGFPGLARTRSWSGRASRARPARRCSCRSRADGERAAGRGWARPTR